MRRASQEAPREGDEGLDVPLGAAGDDERPVRGRRQEEGRGGYCRRDGERPGGGQRPHTDIIVRKGWRCSKQADEQSIVLAVKEMGMSRAERPWVHLKRGRA